MEDINDFIEVRTSITNNTLEYSPYSGVQDFFENHLLEALVNNNQLKFYRLKVGDSIKLNPSDWAKGFVEKEEIEIDKSYEFEYEINNIEIEYFPQNPKTDTQLPLFSVNIMLNRKR